MDAFASCIVIVLTRIPYSILNRTPIGPTLTSAILNRKTSAETQLSRAATQSLALPHAKASAADNL